MTLGAVLFDIDDTLFPSTVFAERARRRAVDAMVHAGLHVTAEDAYRELEQVVAEFSSNHGHHFDNLVLRLRKHLDPAVHPAIVIASGVRAYHSTKEHIKPYPDAVRILDALSRSDLARAILSNGLTVKQAEKLVRLGLERAFTPGAIYISEEIGIAKPHPKIFLIACEKLGVAPADALYVGDNPITDIDPAREAGMHTCLRVGDGKHRQTTGTHEPELTVRNFDELRVILAEKFGVVFRS
ncbi:MAG: TIGR02253 family HAD-type hydrolase [Planctomycetota bacterium]|jgi:putative hydrolase of the HAD superfamily